MTVRLADHQAGQAVAVRAGVAALPSERAARSHRQSPGLTTTVGSATTAGAAGTAAGGTVAGGVDAKRLDVKGSPAVAVGQSKDGGGLRRARDGGGLRRARDGGLGQSRELVDTGTRPTGPPPDTELAADAGLEPRAVTVSVTPRASRAALRTAGGAKRLSSPRAGAASRPVRAAPSVSMATSSSHPQHAQTASDTRARRGAVPGADNAGVAAEGVGVRSSAATGSRRRAPRICMTEPLFVYVCLR